ncbi:MULTISPECIES: hypothetical protein [Phaeobacter]|uniref:hypothetical protein n=1 Tax=Phaeobacter TaxID=302485 RepID=UPI00058F5D83|nr:MULTISPECIES: hypothetical protein [Phaeobacter]KII18282.1 hypothetical protein OO25_04790 [Phaeobacter sp. S60]
MEVINRDWLSRHLEGCRGEQARLSRETGISADKINKILKGNRRIQLSEAPLIYRFFYPEDGQAPAGDQQRLLEVWYQLAPAERDFLLKSAKGLLSAHRPQAQKLDKEG